MGRFKALQWARENGCPREKDTCTRTAYSRHLEVLMWARRFGWPWDDTTCAHAARQGHLETLK